MAYSSTKFTSAEHNYTTTDQECLGVINALEEWRCYLEGTEFRLITDHHPLVYLHEQRSAGQLSRRQARWMEYLQRFNGMKWEYRPGRINVADPISRIHDSVLSVLAMSLTVGDIGAQICEGYAGDPRFQQRKPKAAGVRLKQRDGFWYRKNQIVVPNNPELRKQILKEYHDTPFSGHSGPSRTQEAIQRTFWWKGLHTDVQAYVTNCPQCQRNKPLTQKPGVNCILSQFLRECGIVYPWI